MMKRYEEVYFFLGKNIVYRFILLINKPSKSPNSNPIGLELSYKRTFKLVLYCAYQVRRVAWSVLRLDILM